MKPDTRRMRLSPKAQVTVMELVGHTSPEVHRIYAHSNADVLKNGIARLPDVTKSEVTES